MLGGHEETEESMSASYMQQFLGESIIVREEKIADGPVADNNPMESDKTRPQTVFINEPISSIEMEPPKITGRYKSSAAFTHVKETPLVGVTDSWGSEWSDSQIAKPIQSRDGEPGDETVAQEKNQQSSLESMPAGQKKLGVVSSPTSDPNDSFDFSKPINQVYPSHQSGETEPDNFRFADISELPSSMEEPSQIMLEYTQQNYDIEQYYKELNNPREKNTNSFEENVVEKPLTIITERPALTFRFESTSESSNSLKRPLTTSTRQLKRLTPLPSSDDESKAQPEPVKPLELSNNSGINSSGPESDEVRSPASTELEETEVETEVEGEAETEAEEIENSYTRVVAVTSPIPEIIEETPISWISESIPKTQAESPQKELDVVPDSEGPTQDAHISKKSIVRNLSIVNEVQEQNASSPENLRGESPTRTRSKSPKPKSRTSTHESRKTTTEEMFINAINRQVMSKTALEATLERPASPPPAKQELSRLLSRDELDLLGSVDSSPLPSRLSKLSKLSRASSKASNKSKWTQTSKPSRLAKAETKKQEKEKTSNTESNQNPPTTRGAKRKNSEPGSGQVAKRAKRSKEVSDTESIATHVSETLQQSITAKALVPSPASSVFPSEIINPATGKATKVKLPSSAPFSRVWGLWRDDGCLYPGTMVSIFAGNAAKVQFDDGSTGKIKFHELRKFKLNKGDYVEYVGTDFESSQEEASLSGEMCVHGTEYANESVGGDQDLMPNDIAIVSPTSYLDKSTKIKLYRIKIAALVIPKKRTSQLDHLKLSNTEIAKFEGKSPIRALKLINLPDEVKASPVQVNRQEGVLTNMGFLVSISPILPNIMKKTNKQRNNNASGADDEKTMLVEMITGNGGTILEPSQLLGLKVQNKKVVVQFSNESLKDLDTILLVTTQPSSTPKYLIALSLGIPCISSQYVVQCVQKKIRLDWRLYSVPAGYLHEFDMMTNAGQAHALLRDKFDLASLQTRLEEGHGLYHNLSILFILSKTKKSNPETYREIFIAAGATRIEFVYSGNPKSLTGCSEMYDYVFIEEGVVDKKIELGQKVEEYEGYKFEWFKECLIAGRRLNE